MRKYLNLTQECPLGSEKEKESGGDSSRKQDLRVFSPHAHKSYLLIGFIILIGIIALSMRISYLKEKELVGRMTQVCEQDYNRSYFYHDLENFYCVRFPPRSTLDLPYVDMVEVRYK